MVFYGTNCFIHIPKTGGTSVERALVSAELISSAELSGIYEAGTQHQTFQEVLKTTGGSLVSDRFDFTFTFVRNPWDRAVSEISYLRHAGAWPRGQSTWKEDLRFLVARRERVGNHDLGPQVDYLKDDRGKMAMNFVGRFERLQEDFDTVCARLKIPRQVLPHEQKAASQRGHYSDYYDAESRDWIAERYAEDIKAFGYSFEPADRRLWVAAPLPPEIPLIRPPETLEWPLWMHCPHGVPEAIRHHFFQHQVESRLAGISAAVGMEEITVMTFNNRSNSGLVERQAARMALPHFRVLARDVAQWSWAVKVGSPLRALQGGQITTPYVLVLDGDDMLAVAPLDGGVMISTLEKSGADLLFCSTTQDWPPTPECKAYETKVAPACDWPFLSAGGVFGRTDEYRECCEIILANWAAGDPAVLHDGRFNDQKAWRWIHRMRYPKVKVDVERGIFGRYDATWPELAAVLNPPPPPSISVEEKRGMLEHAVVINLDRAPERLKMATEELGREGISWQRISAVDGTKAKHLRGHRAAGAYALGLTLRLLLRRALREGWPSVCIFEDDVVLADDFLKKFLACPVPEDWGLFYFGANHVHAPQVAGAGLLRVKGAYTTHGFVIHRRYFKTLLTAWSGRGSHQPPIEAVDVALQRLHKTVPTYACWPNLA